MGVVHTGENKDLGGAAYGVGVAGRSADAVGTYDAERTTSDATKALKDVFGGGIRAQAAGPLSMSMASGFDRKSTRGHSTTGIPYAIAGTASVVELDVAERLSAFSDPIRAILGTGVHESQKVIIKRQYVAGGGASIVPERAPARTVAIQEDVREVVLTRYGADIEFNMNLLLRPTDFQREMSIKLNAQQESLQMELIRMGYDMLMTEGTSLLTALVASNPVGSATPMAAQQTAERLYVSSVFGAMQRFPYPVHNLLAAAKHASSSTIATAERTVLIIPTGLPELHKYTKPENMVSYIHGAQHGDPLTAMVTGGVTDVSTNTTVYTHVPPVNNMHGAANPAMEESLLATDVVFATFAEAGSWVYDHLTRGYKELAKDTIRVYRASMLSAILGVPNGNNQATGELLVGYPSTMVGNDVSTEVGRMRLRVYMGSVLYRPENVMILPDVAFNGLHEIVTVTGAVATAIKSSFNGGTHADMTDHGANTGKCTGGVSVSDATGKTWTSIMTDLGSSHKINVYQAATWSDGAATTQTNRNSGHLGCLDGHECGDRVFGVNVYSATPKAT